MSTMRNEIASEVAMFHHRTREIEAREGAGTIEMDIDLAADAVENILALIRERLTSDAAVEAVCSVIYGPSEESLYPDEKPWAFDDLRRALTAALDAITGEQP